MSEEMKAEFVQVGDIVTGKVVKVEQNQALVDIGYKSEAILPISEVSSLHVEQVADEVQDEQELRVKVIRYNQEEDQFVVSKKAVDAESAWEALQEKFESGKSIVATVADVVKGGLVVNVGIRGFIPASLVELRFVEDFSEYKGKELELKVVELDKEKNKCILSRKAVLEAEANQNKEQTLNSIEVGSVLEGTVQRITDFGAFIDIGGVDGLVHVSEIAWHRVGHPSEAVNVGDSVQVKVLKVDRENERISLSMKETQEGPWQQVAREIQVDDVVKGEVKRLVSFGAFVEVFPGVEGLVHISQISHHHIGTPSEVLKEGEEVQVKVLDIQPDQKRISLSIRDVSEQPAPVKKETKETVKEDNSSFGVTLGDMYPELRNLK
ncbi:30S ribosomal protein S1 [Shimazuella alba]|uniref:30S ribosomal protein S1 n=1 Tax=Shimazuella alba TaxID=2690964 RepID=A0A6I4VQK9_9BACL|nr:30S ribosomal protein S1 [Shimazuella alba]MXQ52236.1 30S ribosomal protein S1 [Shimazuella alba]